MSREIKDKEGNLSAIFFIRKFPEHKEELFNLIEEKVELLEANKKLVKLLDPIKDMVAIKVAEPLFKKYDYLWEELVTNSPFITKYIFTHKRFVAARDRRLNQARAEAWDKDKFDQDFIDLGIVSEKIENLGVDPVKVKKKKIEVLEKKEQYLGNISKLENKIDNLQKHCGYLYRLKI